MKKLLLAGFDDSPWREKLARELNILDIKCYDPSREMKNLWHKYPRGAMGAKSEVLLIESALLTHPDTVVLYVNSKYHTDRYDFDDIIEHHHRCIEHFKEEDENGELVDKGRGNRVIFWFPYLDFNSDDRDRLMRMGAMLNGAGAFWSRAHTMQTLAEELQEYVTTWEDVEKANKDGE